MRCGFVVLALAVFPSVLVAQAQREDSDAGPRVYASVTRSARIAPDRAMLYALVEASAETAAEAVTRAEAKVQAVTAAAGQLGSQVGDVTAVPSGVGVVGPTGVSYPGSPAPTQYMTRFMVRVGVPRIAEAARVAAALIAAGATSASVSVLETSAADSVRRVLYADALVQARRDAETLAASLGGRLGALIEAVGSAPQSGTQSGSFVGTIAPYVTGMQLQDVAVSVTATVRYQFIPR